MRAPKTISLLKRICACVVLSAILHTAGKGQCTAPFASVTYDTLITGSGNDHHAISLSQFNPSIGTLMAVDVSSVVSVNYGFTLKNTNTIPINFSISVGRNDNFQSSALTADYSNSIMANVGTFALSPNQIITQSPVTVINRYDNNLHLTSNLISFLGSDAIGFDYSPQTYTDHSGSSLYQYSASANDTIHFSVTYYYCGNIVLTPTLNNFTAKKTAEHQAALNWNISNEQKNRTYEIQKSNDELNFSGVGTLESQGDKPQTDYAFNYVLQQDENHKLFFRVRITDANGAVSYSPIRMVDFDERTDGIRLFPNPSSQFINIQFTQAATSKWIVDILSSNGSLVQQNHFSHVGLARVDFMRPLAAGIYFAKITDVDQHTIKVIGFTVR